MAQAHWDTYSGCHDRNLKSLEAEELKQEPRMERMGTGMGPMKWVFWGNFGEQDEDFMIEFLDVSWTILPDKSRFLQFWSFGW